MSDLLVRVRYHDIEVEVQAPISDGYSSNVEQTSNIVRERIAAAAKAVEQLIIAGRRPCEP